MKKYLHKLDILGLLCLVAAFFWYSVANVWGKWNLGLAILGGALVLIGIAANYRQILASFGKRSTKYAANYVISLVLVIAVVFGLNFIGQRHVKRFDTTASGQFTLAPQTVQVLENLDEDIHVRAFFPGGGYAPLEELLVEYRTLNRHVRYEFIDPDRQPEIAKKYGVSVYGVLQNPYTMTQHEFGTVVVSYGGRSEKIEKRSEEVEEEDITNAIIKVGRKEAKKIYFVQGHGEKDPSDIEQAGYSEAKKALEDQGYEVGTIVLASVEKVPEDARVLIIAGPTTEPFSQEFEFINDFLNRGACGLMVLVDPFPAPSLQDFLKDWGVGVDNNLVLDVSGAGRLMGTGPSVPLVLEYKSHKITEDFDTMTFFPLTRSVKPEEDAPEGITVESLFESNPSSWGETDLNNPEASYDPSADLEGPLSLAVAVEKEIKPTADNDPALKARMVVAGTSSFPVNAYFAAQGNGNMFLNMISWLALDEDLISIRPKPREDRRILLSQSQQSLIKLITIYFLPGIALIIGIVVVLKRRRR
jgi:ABC-type uncharacterized transport system involved in gliding motility auxiliary subunit